MLSEEGNMEEENNKGDQMYVEQNTKIRDNIKTQENWEEREKKCVFKQNAFGKETSEQWANTCYPSLPISTMNFSFLWDPSAS